MRNDISWLTEDICRVMLRKKGSAAKAAEALGVSHTALTARINPLNKTKKDCPLTLTSYGYDNKSRIAWPTPYPVAELKKWIRDALVGQKIIVATSPWETFTVATRFFLSKAERLGQVELDKGNIRVEMTRIGECYE